MIGEIVTRQQIGSVVTLARVTGVLVDGQERPRFVQHEQVQVEWDSMLASILP